MAYFFRSKYRVIAVLVCLSTSIAFGNACASETQTKLWTAAVWVGPLAKDSRYIYFIEPDLRFVDNSYKFSQALLWAALGYEFPSSNKLLIGDAANTTRNNFGEYIHTNVLWQQYDFGMLHYDNSHVFNRVRMQEAKNLQESQWSIILRERVLYKHKIPFWDNHAIGVSDEIFINMKHPDWVPSNKFIAENRFMISLDNYITKQVNFAVSYMNQLEFGRQQLLSHVLLLAMEVKSF